MKTVLLLALLTVLAISATARIILQHEYESGAANPHSGKNHRRGRHFNFRKHRNASSTFDSIDKEFGTALLERVLRNSDLKGGRHQLVHDLESDNDMGVDLDAEAVIYVCEGLVASASAPEQQAAEIASGLGPGDADPLAANAWTLSSRPASTKKLWLDFKGGDVTGTAWNAAKGITTITIPPYDKDSAPTSFSTSELNDIVAIWRGVSEDYSPFDIDVTTIPQLSADPTTYMRVMVGGDGAWNGGGAGGIAYVGVFGQSNTYYQPAFVFPQNLGPNYAKYVWEAVSHESGHTMGLNHDGTSTTGYWQGNSASYGAIMGVGYYSQLTAWDKGEYVDANNQQDDTAIIASKLGYIANENGNSISTATPLTVTVTGSSATGSASGIVAQQNTPDVFSFTAGSGAATITVTTVIPWAGSWARSDLDAKVDIFDSAGGSVATVNPAGTDSTNGLGISGASVTLPAAGTYYVAVSGAGLGAANTDTGYSSYGIRGQYAISVAFTVPPTGVNPTPSPSPAVLPSPSPSPAVPSPSPVLIEPMTVSVSMSCKSTTTTIRRYTCTAAATVRDSAGLLLPGATITGRYTTGSAATGFPTTYYTAVAGSTGKATFTAAPKATKTSVTETFTVKTATLAGYSWTGPVAFTKTF